MTSFAVRLQKKSHDEYQRVTEVVAKQLVPTCSVPAEDEDVFKQCALYSIAEDWKWSTGN